MELREIIWVITSKEILAPYQIAIILDISAKYFIPIHRILWFFLPKSVIKRIAKKNFEQLNWDRQNTIIQNQKNTITILKDSIIDGKLLERYFTGKTIILCPDDFTVYRLEKEIGKRTDILYIPNESTDTKKSQWWIDIYNQKYNIIVWNRKILYYNLSEYQHIIYLEDSFWREYFHYPIKIDYIDIVRMIEIQKIFNIHILTSVPRLTTLTYFRHFHTEYISTLWTTPLIHT